MPGECIPGHEVVRDPADLASALGGAGGQRGVVAVIDGEAESWLDEHGGIVANAGPVGVVSLGDTVRSTSTDTGSSGRPLLHVSGVDDPADVSALGRAVAEHVRTSTARGHAPVVVFDAVEPVVEAAGLEATFRLIHLLSALSAREGGRLVTVVPPSLDRDAADTLAALAN